MNNDLKINMKFISSSDINMKLEETKPIDANMGGGIVEIDPIFVNSPAYTITYNDINFWNNKSDFSGNYNDLTNKPIIPTNTSQLFNDSGFIDKNVNNLANYTLSTNISEVGLTGNYNDLLNTPTIPTKTSQLTNDSDFITNTVDDLTNYTLTSSLSTVATSGSYNDLTNTPTLATVATSGLYQDLINKPTLSTVASTGDYADLTNKPTIPTKTSDLSNDSGFVTNTDYSSYASGGVVRCNSNGFNVNSSGWPYSETFTYSQYSDKTNAHFISKGTLENVITGKGLVSSSSLATVATSGSYNDLTNTPTIPDVPVEIYSGTLKGTESTVLTGVKNKLIIYAIANGANIVYILDKFFPNAGSSNTSNRASGSEWAYDTASGLEFYLSEAIFDSSTNTITHSRTGYINIGTGTYTARNSNSGYYIYKIETV